MSKTLRTRRYGRLADLTVTAPTRKLYDHALRTFFRYLRQFQIPYPDSAEDLDYAAADFIQYLYQDGAPQQVGRNFAAALQDAVPPSRRQLPTTWRWLAAWSKQEPPRRATPLPPEVAFALASVLVSVGRPDAGAVALTAFHALLRTGEAVSLTRGQLGFSSDMCTCVIALPLTKTSRRKNAQEAVSVTDKLVVQSLWRAAAGLAPGERLLRSSAGSF